MNKPVQSNSKGIKVAGVVLSVTSIVLVLASVIFTISAQVSIAQILEKFYVDTAKLAPGTGIRPMGLTMEIGIIETLSIMIGGICALFGGITSVMQRRWWLAILAVLVGVASSIPMFYSSKEINRIVTVRRLVMEP